MKRWLGSGAQHEVVGVQRVERHRPRLRRSGRAASRLVIPPIEVARSASSASRPRRGVAQRRRWPAARRRARRRCGPGCSACASGSVERSRAAARSKQVHGDPGSRSISAKPSCSCLARCTHSTSSKSRSSLLVGVSRFSSRPGRCRITCRSGPTSESTWKRMSDPLRLGSCGCVGRGRPGCRPAQRRRSSGTVPRRRTRSRRCCGSSR